MIKRVQLGLFSILIAFSTIAWSSEAVAISTIIEQNVSEPFSFTQFTSTPGDQRNFFLQEASTQPTGQIGGSILSIAIQGDFVYLGYGPRLIILNVADIASIGAVVTGQTDILPGIVQDIFVSGDYAYIIAEQAGLRIIDISNKSAPVEVGSFSPYYPARRVVVEGNFAYILAYNELYVVQVTNPTNPVEISSTYIPGAATAMAVRGNYAYVANGDLAIFDISNKTAPAEVAHIDTPGNADDITLAGNYAYVQEVTTGFRVINISNPTHPLEVGAYNTFWMGDGLTVAGNYVYASTWADGLRVIDVSNPSNPLKVADYNPGGYSYETVIGGNYAYIACELIGLCVVNISDPTHPSLLDQYYFRPSGFIKGLVVVDNYVYAGS